MPPGAFVLRPPRSGGPIVASLGRAAAASPQGDGVQCRQPSRKRAAGGSLLYDPQGPRPRLPGRARRGRRASSSTAPRPTPSTTCAGPKHRLRLRLPRQHVRLRHQPDVHPLQRRRLDLRRGLRRRPSQHPDRRRDRHRARDDPRLRRRRRAAVDELDRQQARDGLRRGHPQRPAAAAAAVLVQRGAGAAAGCRATRSSVGTSFFLNNRGLFMPKPVLRRAAPGSCSAVVRRRHRRGDRLPASGPSASRRRPAASTRSASPPLGLDPRPAGAGLDLPRAHRRQPDHLRPAAALALQPDRRHADPARVRGAARRPRHLHGRLHRRGRARRHPRRLHAARRRPRTRSACGPARPCAWWSSRRPCG